MEMEPERVSEALAISSRYPEEVDASEFTTIVWVPAMAEDDAEVRARTLGSELEPSFCARTP